MARKTNEELRMMTVQELESYDQQHPGEAGRISKILANSSAKIFKVAVKYAISGNMQSMVELGAIEPV